MHTAKSARLRALINAGLASMSWGSWPAWVAEKTFTDGCRALISAAHSGSQVKTCSAGCAWTAGSTSTRRYTVVLGGTTSSSWTAAGSLPAINLLELGYVANRTAGVYGNFGDSLVGSAGGNGGFLMAAATGGGSFGAVSVTNFVIVPTPGAAALAIVAGIASFRRRRA